LFGTIPALRSLGTLRSIGPRYALGTIGTLRSLPAVWTIGPYVPFVPSIDAPVIVPIPPIDSAMFTIVTPVVVRLRSLDLC
jgi:hypothetical protein